MKSAFCVLQVVTEMGQPRLGGFGCQAYGESFIHAHVRGMRFASQRIDDEMRDSANLFNHLRWNLFAVAQVGGQLFAVAREEISEGGHAPVRDGEGRKHGFAQAEWLSDDVRHGVDVARPAILAIEGEEKDPPEIGDRLLRAIDRQRARIGAEGAEIIESQDVIRVRVGEDDRVHPPDVFPKTLHPKIRSGIDDKGDLRCFDVDG